MLVSCKQTHILSTDEWVQANISLKVFFSLCAALLSVFLCHMRLGRKPEPKRLLWYSITWQDAAPSAPYLCCFSSFWCCLMQNWTKILRPALAPGSTKTSCSSLRLHSSLRLPYLTRRLQSNQSCTLIQIRPARVKTFKTSEKPKIKDYLFYSFF